MRLKTRLDSRRDKYASRLKPRRFERNSHELNMLKASSVSKHLFQNLPLLLLATKVTLSGASTLATSASPASTLVASASSALTSGASDLLASTSGASELLASTSGASDLLASTSGAYFLLDEFVGRVLPSKKILAWKYGTQVEVSREGAKKEYVYIKCNFSEKCITGSVKRLKDHLACTHVNIGQCTKVPEEVKKECRDYLKKFATSKEITQINMKEMIRNFSYYGSQHEGSSSRSQFVTAYLTLQRFKELRQPLEAMFTSEEWDKRLLVKVLRMLDGDRAPRLWDLFMKQ
ncbi:hypothetical protein M5K25_019567 [Dendrobium thyrsiflorum]|uniref:Uncharacterized protein n=1 Tax=Dendrobium thyrsiflorum TaxID=117978 RepID=A0ABD0UM51_DENTH